MRLIGDSNKIAAITNQESLRLARVYKVAEEMLNKKSTVTEAKDIFVETFSRMADQDIIKHKATATQKIYDLAVRAFVHRDEKAKEALKTAFVTEMAMNMDNEVDAVNTYNLYSQLFDQVFDQMQLSLEGANIAPQTIPYILFSAPLLRFMMPRLVSNEIFTVMPMKGPSVAMYFLKYYQDQGNLPYPFASYLQNQNGQLVPGSGLGGYGTNPGGTMSLYQAGVISNTTASTTTVSFNVVSALKAVNLVPASITQADLAMGSVIVSAVNVSGTVVNVNARASEAGIIYGSGVSGGVSAIVSGRVDFVTGNAQLQITVTGGTIYDVLMGARITYEYRNPARTVNLKFERFEIDENRIEETLIASPEFLYDSKVLFDIDLQAEIIGILGTLMAVNTDSFLLMKLFNTLVSTGSPAIQVSAQAPSNFLLGTTKWWYEGAFLPAIFELEAALRYNTPSLDVKPYLVMNPIDASFIRSTDKYTAKLSDNEQKMQLGKVVQGTVDGVIDILVTPLLPQGTNIMVLKSTNPMFATAVYAPYVTLFMPYPANTIGPALTGTHRFGAVIPLPRSIGAFTVTNETPFPQYLDV